MHFVLLVDCTDKCMGRYRCGSTLKNELPKPRGSLANDIPSHAIEQADQEVRQDGAIHSMCQTHNNFHIFKFCVLFNFIY